jgi:hypothetical protein
VAQLWLRSPDAPPWAAHEEINELPLIHRAAPGRLRRAPLTQVATLWSIAETSDRPAPRQRPAVIIAFWRFRL